MGTLSIIDVHLDKNVSRVVVQWHRVIFIVIDTSHITIPGDTSAEKSCIKLAFSLTWILLKGLIPASLKISGPGYVTCAEMSMICIFNQDKYIDRKSSSKNHYSVEDRTSCKYDTKSSNIPCEQSVLKRWKTEVRAILHLIQTLRTSMNRCFSQTNQEWHQD